MSAQTKRIKKMEKTVKDHARLHELDNIVFATMQEEIEVLARHIGGLADTAGEVAAGLNKRLVDVEEDEKIGKQCINLLVDAMETELACKACQAPPDPPRDVLSVCKWKETACPEWHDSTGWVPKNLRKGDLIGQHGNSSAWRVIAATRKRISFQGGRSGDSDSLYTNERNEMASLDLYLIARAELHSIVHIGTQLRDRHSPTVTWHVIEINGRKNEECIEVNNGLITKTIRPEDYHHWESVGDRKIRSKV